MYIGKNEVYFIFLNVAIVFHKESMASAIRMTVGKLPTLKTL